MFLLGREYDVTTCLAAWCHVPWAGGGVCLGGDLLVPALWLKVTFSYGLLKVSFSYGLLIYLRQGNVFTPVCDSVHRGDTPPRADTPLDRPPPPTIRRPLQRTVRILLECILVFMFYNLKVYIVSYCSTFLKIDEICRKCSKGYRCSICPGSLCP